MTWDRRILPATTSTRVYPRCLRNMPMTWRAICLPGPTPSAIAAAVPALPVISYPSQLRRHEEGSLRTSTRTEVAARITFSANAHTATRRRRRRRRKFHVFIIGRVHVLNDPPATLRASAGAARCPTPAAASAAAAPRPAPGPARAMASPPPMHPPPVGPANTAPRRPRAPV
jgi:hypothetical protein